MFKPTDLTTVKDWTIQLGMLLQFPIRMHVVWKGEEKCDDFFPSSIQPILSKTTAAMIVDLGKCLFQSQILQEKVHCWWAFQAHN